MKSITSNLFTRLTCLLVYLLCYSVFYYKQLVNSSNLFTRQLVHSSTLSTKKSAKTFEILALCD